MFYGSRALSKFPKTIVKYYIGCQRTSFSFNQIGLAILAFDNILKLISLLLVIKY